MVTITITMIIMAPPPAAPPMAATGKLSLDFVDGAADKNQKYVYYG